MSIEGSRPTNERCPVCVSFGISDSFISTTPTGARCSKGQHSWSDSSDLLDALREARSRHRELYPEAQRGDNSVIKEVVIDSTTKSEIEGRLGQAFTSGPHLKGLIYAMREQIDSLQKTATDAQVRLAEAKSSSPSPQLKYNQFVIDINEGLLGGIFQEATARKQTPQGFVSHLFSEFLKQECFTLFKNEFAGYLERYVDPGERR